MRKAYLLVSLLPLACGQSGPSSPGQVRGAMVVLHTRTNILTAPAGNWSADSPLRARVEASFPSACVDLDDDDDGVPNVVDVDHVDDAADVVEDQCHRCNRGPGEAGDFRLRVEGTDVRLDRGVVLARAADGTLTVPSLGGRITILVTPATQVEGVPTPGSEIRAEGTLTGTNAFTATRLEVLCPGPAPLNPADVPPEAEPVPDDPAHHT
ncbi:MAG TPA: DUF5666 domain-containing protein [Haliangiales bacterium]|nr:DUF5666 domain-containing protein [Haliangiales bacterium]